MAAAKGFKVLTDDQVRILRIAQGSPAGDDTLARAIDNAASGAGITALPMSAITGLTAALATKLTATQAANVAALAGTLTGSVTGTMADVAAIALSTSDTYTDAAVNGAVNAAITAVNLQLKELQTKMNAEIAALKAANIQASV